MLSLRSFTRLSVGALSVLPLAVGCGEDEPQTLGNPSAEIDLEGGVKLAPKGSPAVVNSQLSVCGNKLCNEAEFPIQLRGMSTHGLQWFESCYSESSWTSLAEDWGADVVRLALYVEEDAQGYLTNPYKFRSLMDRHIELISRLGMYVIVDWHQLGDGDPRTNLEEAKEYFAYMAKQHAHRTNVFYEIANEPNGVSWDGIKEYAEEIIPIIREHDKEAVILVGTPGWSSLGLSDGKSPEEIAEDPLEFDNVMYTFHFYAASHQSYLGDVEEASEKLPIFVSEWGSQNYSGEGENDFDAAGDFLDLFEEKQISWVNWNFSDDFRSGAALKSGSCSASGWTGNSLKEAGSWVQKRILEPADDFQTEGEPPSMVGGAGGESH